MWRYLNWNKYRWNIVSYYFKSYNLKDFDDDDDFMYTGQVKSYYDETDEQTFSANFEFMQTQNFSAEGFDSSSTAITSFADFASFNQDISTNSFSNDVETSPFSDFANFDTTDFDNKLSSTDII